MESNIYETRARLMSLVGEFSLSPEIMDWIKYVRARGNVKADDLLAVATGV